MGKDKKQIAEYYDKLVATYGHDARSCDYGSDVSQKKKFDVLSECCDLSGLSLLDVGCGFCDYYQYLRERSVDVQYTGMDLSRKMIETARALHPELSLINGDFETEEISPVDVLTANGIFYLLGEGAEATMREIVQKMFNHAKVAVAFNALSSWRKEKEDSEFYADPIETLRFCSTLTPWVTLRHDYHPGDFTVYMFKGPAK